MTVDYSKLPPECDELCQWRWCLHKGENKGIFVRGRGYTSYFEKPEYVCMTRILHGCPMILDHRPLPDKEKIIDHLSQIIRHAKTSNKVKDEMNKMLKIIKLLFEIAEKELAQTSEITKEPTV